MVFLIFSIGMTAGGSRFFRELVPPEMKKQAGKEVQITGQVYQIEVRESYQILYLILSKNHPESLYMMMKNNRFK